MIVHVFRVMTVWNWLIAGGFHVENVTFRLSDGVCSLTAPDELDRAAEEALRGPPDCVKALTVDGILR